MKKLLLLMLLFAFFAFNEAYAQKVITGTVRTSDNSALVGATVSLKNSKISTITNADGKFQISVPAEKVV